MLLVGCAGLKAFAHIEDVALHVLLHRIPGSTAEAKAVALADGVEPQALVLANLLARLKLKHIARTLAEITANVVVIVDLAKEADALRVFAFGVDKMLALSNGTHLLLHVVANGEERLAQLPVVDLREEVGLVLNGVRAGYEPFVSVGNLGLGIMARGYEVIVVPHLGVESTKLYQTVTHHVGVGGEAGAHLVHGVTRHLVPIFLMAVDNLKVATIASCHGCCHLKVFLRGAVPFLLFLWPDLYVEAVGMQSLTCHLVNHHRTVDAAREQHRYLLVIKLLVFCR